MHQTVGFSHLIVIFQSHDGFLVPHDKEKLYTSMKVPQLESTLALILCMNQWWSKTHLVKRHLSSQLSHYASFSTWQLNTLVIVSFQIQPKKQSRNLEPNMVANSDAKANL